MLSIDESNFRSDSLPTMQWEFNKSSMRSCSKARQVAVDSRQNKSVLFSSEDYIQYGNMLNKFSDPIQSTLE